MVMDMHLLSDTDMGVSAAASEEESPYMTEISDLPHTVIHHIFGMLGPKELCIASAVCKDWRELNRDNTSNRTWQEYYAKRWQAPRGVHNHQWQIQYGKKMINARAFSNKGLMDILYGHTGAVTGCALLPSCNLLATGSIDNTVRLWDLKAGLPLASSRQLKGPIRALAMDESMLVCGGGPDGMVRLWRSRNSVGNSLFDLTIPTRLIGHTGPVSSVTLDQRHIISASWDCTVRIWNKANLKRDSLLAFPDWIHSVKSRAGNLLVTAGNVLHGHSMETGQALFKLGHSALKGNSHWDESRTTAPLQVEGSQDGKLVFLAGSDGAIVSVDLRCPKSGSTVLWDQKSSVKSLKYEHPWLAAATSDGSVLLIDAESSTPSLLSSGRKHRTPSEFGKKKRASRQRLNGSNEAALCVDIQDNFVVCGSCDPIVRTWHFEHTEKKDKRAMTAPRRSRQSRTSRFPYHPDSGGSDSNEEIIHTNKLPSSNIALSASLPSELGGMTKFLANKHKITSRHRQCIEIKPQDELDSRGVENEGPSEKAHLDSCEEKIESPTHSKTHERWDKQHDSEMPSDSSEYSDEAMMLARRTNVRENEYKISDSPLKGSRARRDKFRTPILSPANCRSESRNTKQEHMTNWTLCTSRMNRWQ